MSHTIKAREGERESGNFHTLGTDKKENQIFIIQYIRKFRSGAVAKSYMRKGFLLYEEISS
jgi:hypothetical protein